ncbi:MAG: hypothetical protein ABSF00_03945 [Candidatus Bathyarchaeia archaeon]
MGFESEFRNTLIFAIVYVFVEKGLTYLLTLPVVPSQLLFALTGFYDVGTFAVSFVLALGLFSLLTIRRTPKGLRAYLFFPKGTTPNNKNLDFHGQNFNHRLIVNFKTTPPAAFVLTPDSYAWKLVKKQGEAVLSKEIDTAPNDPNFLERWCKKRGYVLSPEVPDRTPLLGNGRITKPHRLDIHYEHMRYEGFFPFYCYLLPMMIKNTPHRRVMLNLSSMKAFPMDSEQWYWATCGRIKGHVGIASPRLQHAKKWATEHEFEWVQFPKKGEMFEKNDEERQANK